MNPYDGINEQDDYYVGGPAEPVDRNKAIDDITRRMLDCYPVLACHEASVRAHVAWAYEYGHHHAIVGLTEELARLRGEAPRDAPVCSMCKRPMRAARNELGDPIWQCSCPVDSLPRSFRTPTPKPDDEP